MSNQLWTVTQISADGPIPWGGNFAGQNESDLVGLQGHSEFVEVGRRVSTPTPKIGSQLYGTINPDTRAKYGWKFKKGDRQELEGHTQNPQTLETGVQAPVASTQTVGGASHGTSALAKSSAASPSNNTSASIERRSALHLALEFKKQQLKEAESGARDQGEYEAVSVTNLKLLANQFLGFYQSDEGTPAPEPNVAIRQAIDAKGISPGIVSMALNSVGASSVDALTPEQETQFKASLEL